MIARHQTILFIILVVACLGMGGLLWHQLDRAHQRLLKGEDSAPTQAPEIAPAEKATLLVANDADNALITQIQILPLPQDDGVRARLILGKLFDLYDAAGSTHPIAGGAASVAQVFLLPAPRLGAEAASAKRGEFTPHETASAAGSDAAKSDSTGPELAVVNLTANFAASQPSGLEAESLTLLSICGTLHANLPRITQVRFLIDGQTRLTLAGHADLTRTYLAGDSAPAEGGRP